MKPQLLSKMLLESIILIKLAFTKSFRIYFSVQTVILLILTRVKKCFLKNFGKFREKRLCQVSF